MQPSHPALVRAVQRLLRDHFRIEAGHQVVVTADDRSDAGLVGALADGAAAPGAPAAVRSLPHVLFQGRVANPHTREPVVAAVGHCDVWLDLSFPYLAGSGPFEQANKQGRVRYLLMGDLDADAFARLYGTDDFDALFALQAAVDRLFADAAGRRCRITSPAGTELECLIGPPGAAKQRHAVAPGAHTVPGSALFQPQPDSARGVIAIESVCHRYFTRLEEPLRLEVEGTVRGVNGGGVDRALLERALKRAGHGAYGGVIHLTVGLNPAARSTGRSFIEEIRVVGRNAIGLGLPWWVEGGGENHPDGVVEDQSLWIDGEPILERGRFVHPPLASLFDAIAL